jgi:hypothetical protein
LIFDYLSLLTAVLGLFPIGVKKEKTNRFILYLFQVFKPDDKNGLEIQSQVDALLERQKRENMQSVPKTPVSR